MGINGIHNNKLLGDAEISIFCHQMSMVVRAGLPIHYGIAVLRDEALDDKLSALYNTVYAPMEQGASLYAAIAATGAFPAYMVQMVHLGEETGRLEEVLDSLTSYYEREAEIRVSIRHALIYPIIMTFLMIIVLGLVLTQIVPVFSRIYEELIGELTGMGLVLMQISNILNKYALFFVIVLLVLAGINVVLYKTALGKIIFQGKGLSMSIATGHFANCMHLALASGLDTDRSLELAEGLIDNPYMLDKIDNCKLRIRHGETFVEAVIHAGIFSRVYSGLLIIGAKTGSMVAAMQRISQAYEEASDRMMRRIITVLEPLLIVILSIFIGLILFAFVVPVLNVII